MANKYEFLQIVYIAVEKYFMFNINLMNRS